MRLISSPVVRRPGLIMAAAASLFVCALLLVVRSDPFSYCGYCQRRYTEQWVRGNAYPCSYWRYVTTHNSSDFTLYLNTPAP